MFAYNCTPHTTTGYSPFKLLFGQDHHLPVDLMLGKESRDDDDVDIRSTWLREHKERLRFAHSKALDRIKKSQEARRKASSKNVYQPDIAVGYTNETDQEVGIKSKIFGIRCNTK